MNLQEMSQGQPSAGASRQPTADEQAQFDTLLGSCRQVMADTAEEWMQALQADPVAAAVKMGTQTVRYFVQKYEEAGQPFAPEVIIHAGITLVKDIAGVVNENGLVPDEQLEPFLQDVMQQSIAEYLRMDADEGLLEGVKLPGDPKTPDDTEEHEGAETPELERQEMANEEPGEDEDAGDEKLDEEEEMAMQLANIRKQGGAK